MQYTRTYLKSRLNAAIRNQIGTLTDPNETCNQAVREVFSETNFRSAKRKLQMPAGLFSDQYSYPGPVDLNGVSIVDIAPIDPSNRSNQELNLRLVEEFWRNFSTFNCAVDDSDGYKKVLISIPVSSTSQTVSTLDSVTAGGGTWEAFSLSTDNVETNSDDYIKGSGSVSFDINAVSGTTAGIKNDSIDTFDYSDFLRSWAFSHVYIVDKDNILNFKLRIGDDDSNYYEMTATVTNENTPFQNGWNLLRFSFASKTTVGSPSGTNGAYAALYMTKTTSKVSEAGYLFDQIILSKGPAYVMTYYSQYGWINTDGTYLLDSTDDLDVIVANADEFDMILAKTIAIASEEVGEDALAKTFESKYINKRNLYLTKNPDESLLLITEYYKFI